MPIDVDGRAAAAVITFAGTAAAVASKARGRRGVVSSEGGSEEPVLEGENMTVTIDELPVALGTARCDAADDDDVINDALV